MVLGRAVIGRFACVVNCCGACGCVRGGIDHAQIFKVVLRLVIIVTEAAFLKQVVVILAHLARGVSARLRAVLRAVGVGMTAGGASRPAPAALGV